MQITVAANDTRELFSVSSVLSVFSVFQPCFSER